MMVETKKAAVLIVMACIIAPMLVGYAWPDDKIERIGWESGDTHDITSSYRTEPIPTYSMDYTIISPTWSDGDSGYTETFTAELTPPLSNGIPEMSQWFINNVTFVDLNGMIEDSVDNGGRVAVLLSVATDIGPSVPLVHIPMRLVNPESTNLSQVQPLNAASVGWEGGQVTVIGANGYTFVGTPGAYPGIYGDYPFLIQDSNRPHERTYSITVSYTVPPSSTPSIQMDLTQPSIGGQISVGLTNVGASTTTVENLTENLRLETIINAQGLISGRIVSDSGSVSTGAIGTTSTIPWVRWSWDSVSDKVTFSTMTGEINRGQVFESRSYNVQIDAPISSWRVSYSESSGWRPQVSTYDNLVKSGSTLGIINAAINGNSYYPDGSWQITLKAPSTIGNNIGIAGEFFEIVNGMITIGEETIPIRNMSIFAAGNGDNTSNVYANGVLVASNVYNPAVMLGGMWNTTIILADMDSYTYWTYTKDAGGFGLDVVGFCTVGLITSIGAFLGAVIAGKRSGGRFGLLALVAGICAAFFLLMISNNLNL